MSMHTRTGASPPPASPTRAPPASPLPAQPIARSINSICSNESTITVTGGPSASARSASVSALG
jgi:hypothetical protein